MLNQSMPVDTCFVVNNNSNDGTREYLDSIDDDRVRAYHEETNLGGAGGFSRALTLASREDFDFVLIIDDDACDAEIDGQSVTQFLVERSLVI